MREMKSALIVLTVLTSLSYAGLFDELKKAAEVVDSVTSEKSSDENKGSKEKVNDEDLIANPKNKVQELYNIVCNPNSSLRDRMIAWNQMKSHDNFHKPDELTGDALYYLGECYANGKAEPGSNRGHENDFEYAISRWESASKLDHLKSLKRLGKVYSSDKSGEADIEKAKKYWLRAAELGDSDSVKIIENYFGKNEIEKELAERVTVVLANNGHIDSQVRLGQKLLKEGNVTEAKKYFELAKSEDNEIAIKALEEISQNENEKQKAVQKIAAKYKSIENSLSLTEASYGFPLNVSIDNVVKWVEENKLESTNDSLLGGIVGSCIHVIPCLKNAKTLQDFNEAIISYQPPSDEVINNIPLMERQWLIEQAGNYMSEFDQAKLLAKMADMTPEQKAVEPYRIGEQKIIGNLKAKLKDIAGVDLSDSPLVRISGQQYFLYNVWSEGITVEFEDGSESKCKEERITDSIYKIGFTSSENSPEKFKSFPVKFTIYFYKTPKGDLVSFAQITEYLYIPPQDKLKLKEFLITSLDKKYDGHVVVKPIQKEGDRWDGKVIKNNCVAFQKTYKVLRHKRINSWNDLEGNWYFWALNISAIENLSRYGENRVFMQFWIWESEVAKAILTERENTINKFRNKHKETKEAKFESLEGAF